MDDCLEGCGCLSEVLGEWNRVVLLDEKLV